MCPGVAIYSGASFPLANTGEKIARGRLLVNELMFILFKQ